MADYERVLLVKNEIFVYNIPPRPSVRGHRAADWKLDNPDWTGRLRILSKGKIIWLQLEGSSGELYAKCPVDGYPGVAVEQVTDSSRYFVLKIQDDSGRSAFIGIGFSDRSDSFDLLVSIQDHFKVIKRDEKEAKEGASSDNSGPKLDLSLKEGETIKININTKKSGNAAKARPKTNAAGITGLLPPPPGGNKIAGPPRLAGVCTSENVNTTSVAPAQQSSSNSNSIGLLGLDSLSLQSSHQTQSKPNATSTEDPWGDFANAGSNSSNASNQETGDPWVQF